MTDNKEQKPKGKAAAKPPAKKPAAPKKLTQTTLKTTKKRPVPESDNEDMSALSNTPPSSKKQKKAPVSKKSSGNPLAEIENDSMAPEPIVKGTKKKTVEETYQKLSQLEHIIKRPDTYIGSVEPTESQMWVFNKETKLMEYKKITVVPGLYKIFDEILVNAADIKQRREESGEDPVTKISVTIDREAGLISVENNGKGIPVEMHKAHGIYVPEMIFGHLLTGSNYDDDEKKTTGGRNGYGAKLCNVFSTEFSIECQDSSNGKKYKQTWTDNMSKMGKAKVTSSKSNDYVRVSFKPDFARFSMTGIDDDLESVLVRRVYDMAGTVKNVKVSLNGTVVKPSTFKGYSEMYAKAIAKERAAEEGMEPKVTVEMDKNDNDRWDVGFTVSDGSFQHVSFVNNIATTSGGTHVNYIADQITTYLLKHLDKKKKGHALKANHIKNHIFVFVNCRIENPAFTSQTKEQMTTKISAFGSKCVLTEPFLKKIAASDAIQNIMAFAEKKADKMLAKSDGGRRSRINNAKLVDANLAGTKRGHECTLILTEGDSAKSLAVAGRAILDPDRIGVFPLRGKMLNVRDASLDQITKNQEIQNIKQFLGLKHKTVYTDTKSLRYGHLMIMADQDHDGSHIKGLLINFLQVQFPSLLQIPDFFREFITPIVKIWQGKNPKQPQKLMSFFTQPEYEEWKENHQSEVSKWQYKYYKGLGTSSNEDAQVYFTNLDAHLKEFNTMSSEETQLLDLAFSKKKADARKEWLGNFVPGTYLDHSSKSITYTDFVNKELILFSMADNMRSIPSMIDGLKPGQRKVMFACFKRNLLKDKKVVELAGYVSEQAAYHHGEMSLQQTIIGLAQNFVGSNNVNCLEPSGNFGSRLAGGSDAASARYIHTRLSPFARKIFSVLDEPNLEVQIEDGKPIEPKVYAPVIPMVLCNGADGIGTGWSTTIPNYNPEDIVQNLKRRMGRLDPDDTEEKPFETMTPWFRGWKGTPELAEKDRYKFNGIYEIDDKTGEVIITELPIRTWTDDFKAKLEEVISGAKGPAWIKDYKEFNDHKNVHFVIQMDDKNMKDVKVEGIMERFKLNKQIATSNLVAFDTAGRIRKYEKVEDILEEYYQYRMDMYAERKKYWLGVYHADYRKLKNQARFIQEIIDGDLVVSKKKKAVLVQELRERKYEAFPRGLKKKAVTEEEEMDAEEDEDDEESGNAGDYDYLLSMPIYSLTYERLEKLKQQIQNKKAEHDALLARGEKDLWVEDLDAFLEEWKIQLDLDSKIQTKIRRMGRRHSRKIGAGGGGGKGRAKKDDDDYEPGERKRGPSKAKAAAKPVEKSQKRFAEMFNKPTEDARVTEVVDDDFDDDDFAQLSKKSSAASKAKPKPKSKEPTPAPKIEESDDAFSDGDFAQLGKKSAAASKPQPKAKSKEPTPAPKPEDSDELSDVDFAVPAKKPAKAEPASRGRRAAAAKKSTYVDEDSDEESDGGDDLMEDVGAMVKGIKDSAKEPQNGRVSLFAMNRPESSHGNSSFPKVKPKASKPSFDSDDSSVDETNYEMLARSSPHKSPVKEDDDGIDSFLSDDDEPPVKKAPAKKAAATSKAAAAAAAAAAPKSRGRPAAAAAAAKPKAKASAAATKAKPAPKPVALSPAAKAYAAKKAAATKKKTVISDDEDEDAMDVDEPSSPAPRPARGRRAASKAKPVIIDDEDSSMADPFGMDDSE